MRISTIVSCLIFIACIFAVYAAQANEAYNDEGEYIIVEPVASDEVWIYDSDTLEAEVIEPTDTYEYGDSTEIEYMDQDTGEVHVITIEKNVY